MESSKKKDLSDVIRKEESWHRNVMPKEEASVTLSSREGAFSFSYVILKGESSHWRHPEEQQFSVTLSSIEKAHLPIRETSQWELQMTSLAWKKAHRDYTLRKPFKG